MVTPDELRQYAEVMRDMGLTQLTLGDLIVIRQPGSSRDEEADAAAAMKEIAAAMRLGEEPGDPRDNPASYPDGRPPVFPEFDTSESEEES
jgi:hypothetical protein